jgi:hypothetical protein
LNLAGGDSGDGMDMMSLDPQPANITEKKVKKKPKKVEIPKEIEKEEE